MIQFILVLLGLAFGNHNSGSSCNNNGQSTTQIANPGGGTDPGEGLDPDGPGGGPVTGNTGQLPPPPFTQP